MSADGERAGSVETLLNLDEHPQTRSGTPGADLLWKDRHLQLHAFHSVLPLTRCAPHFLGTEEKAGA